MRKRFFALAAALVMSVLFGNSYMASAQTIPVGGIDQNIIESVNASTGTPGSTDQNTDTVDSSSDPMSLTISASGVVRLQGVLAVAPTAFSQSKNGANNTNASAWQMQVRTWGNKNNVVIVPTTIITRNDGTAAQLSELHPDDRITVTGSYSTSDKTSADGQPSIYATTVRDNSISRRAVSGTVTNLNRNNSTFTVQGSGRSVTTMTGEGTLFTFGTGTTGSSFTDLTNNQRVTVVGIWNSKQNVLYASAITVRPATTRTTAVNATGTNAATETNGVTNSSLMTNGTGSTR